MDGEVIGQVYSVEFVSDDVRAGDDDRTPGTYVTIRVPDGTAWSGGTVIVRYAEAPNK